MAPVPSHLSEAAHARDAGQDYVVVASSDHTKTLGHVCYVACASGWHGYVRRQHHAQYTIIRRWRRIQDADFLTISNEVCDRQILVHRKALLGQKKLEMRKAISKYSAWVEQMREQGKAGKVIKAVLGIHAGRNHQDGLVMDSLR